jgi:hypothetical protein
MENGRWKMEKEASYASGGSGSIETQRAQRTQRAAEKKQTPSLNSSAFSAPSAFHGAAAVRNGYGFS